MSVWEVVVSLCQAVPGVTPERALGYRADLVVKLLEAATSINQRISRSVKGGGGESGRDEVLPDGTIKRSLRTMSDLYGFLQRGAT